MKVWLVIYNPTRSDDNDSIVAICATKARAEKELENQGEEYVNEFYIKEYIVLE
jgi:hypothetical protein